MAIWALLLLAETVLGPAPIHFDLAKLPKSVAPCGKGSGADIVICGSKPDRHRLPVTDDLYAEKAVRAEASLGGGTKLTGHVDEATVGGFHSPRAMVTLSIPLGPGKKD